MARPRTFDEETVVNAAMIAFWKTGFNDTPIDVLEEVTGLKRISIYNTFGDKEGLFLAALNAYYKRAIDVYEDTIAKGSLDSIQNLFSSMTAPVESGSPAHSGCLMVNTVLDVRRASDNIKDRIYVYRTLIKKSFVSALKNACENKEMIADDALIEERATYLLGLLWGALALIRVEENTTAASSVAIVGNEVIDSWRLLRK